MTQQKKLNWIRKIFPLLFDVSVAAVCLYVALRVRRWLNLFVSWESGYLIGGILIVYLILNAMLARKKLVSKSKTFTYITRVSTFVVMYLFMLLLTADIIQLLIHLFIKDQLYRDRIFMISGAVCALIVVIAVAVGYHNTRTLETVNYDVPCTGLRHEGRIVLLSDLHIGFFVGPRHIKKIVDQVNRLDADMVVISGDIINAGYTRECPDIDEVASLLAQMHSKKGTYAVIGNHDPDADEPDFVKFTEAAHITVLDESVHTDPDFYLVGRTTRRNPRSTVHALLGTRPLDRPVLVLDHDPIGVREATEEGGIDLVMCGHTHRGQIFPLNLLVRFMYSKQELWGCSVVGDHTTAVVSAGAGYFSMPMRIGSECEIVSLEMEPESAKA